MAGVDVPAQIVSEGPRSPNAIESCPAAAECTGVGGGGEGGGSAEGSGAGSGGSSGGLAGGGGGAE
jgi:hypothetical protein